MFQDKNRHHVQGGVLMTMYQANANGNILTDTGIPNGGPSRTPFYNIARLAREEARPSTYKSSSPTPNRIYFPELKDTSKSQMHAKHRTVYVDSETGDYAYYQTKALMCQIYKNTKANTPAHSCLINNTH
eukprot:scaffold218096_cov31-Tisochrysis_lutea.AAC.1